MSDSYWLRLGRRSEGPFSLDEMRRRAVRGSVTPAHSVSRDGQNWMAARRCTEIYAEDGSPVPPGQGGPISLAPLDAGGLDEWSSDALAEPASEGLGAAAASAVRALVAAWPAHVSCALTLGVTCGLPMSRDAEGPLWWWHVVRLWDLGGGGLVTAAVAWALVSACTLATSVAIWLSAGTGRLVVLTASAVASMVLAVAAWASGMAGGVWTIASCALIPAAALSVVRSVERPAVPVRMPAGARRPVGGNGIALAALGAVSIILAAVSIFVRDGAPAMACTLLMLAGGAAAVTTVIRLRLAGPDEWTTMVPCGAVVMACGAIICDGLASLAATPVPPSSGTRFAVLDAVRVVAVLLCQCTLAYLARRDDGAVPYAPPALAPTPGMTNT